MIAHHFSALQVKEKALSQNGIGLCFEKPASTYFHRPFPANYLRHK